jgi:hypothetical protein
VNFINRVIKRLPKSRGFKFKKKEKEEEIKSDLRLYL